MSGGDDKAPITEGSDDDKVTESALIGVGVGIDLALARIPEVLGAFHLKGRGRLGRAEQPMRREVKIDVQEYRIDNRTAQPQASWQPCLSVQQSKVQQLEGGNVFDMSAQSKPPERESPLVHK